MNAMRTLLLRQSERDLESEIPLVLRLYPAPAAIDADGIEIFWAPFDHVNRRASLVIVGVTPGPNQYIRSYLAAKNALTRGVDPQAELEMIKAEASFRGDVMEANMMSLLEHSGVFVSV